MSEIYQFPPRPEPAEGLTTETLEAFLADTVPDEHLWALVVPILAASLRFHRWEATFCAMTAFIAAKPYVNSLPPELQEARDKAQQAFSAAGVLLLQQCAQSASHITARLPAIEHAT